MLIKPKKKFWMPSPAVYGKAAGGGGPVAFTFQTSGLGTASSFVQSVPSFTIGAAPSATRRVIILFSSFQVSAGSTFTAVFTPNAGAPVTYDSGQVLGTNGGDGLSYISAVLPLGTTSTADITWNQTFGTGPRFSVYTVDNSALTSPTSPVIGYNAVTTGTTVSATANTLAGGGVLGTAYGNVAGAGETFSSSPAGVTVPNDAVVNSDYMFTHADNVAASTPYTMTFSWTGSNKGGVAILAYR